MKEAGFAEVATAVLECGAADETDTATQTTVSTAIRCRFSVTARKDTSTRTSLVSCTKQRGGPLGPTPSTAILPSRKRKSCKEEQGPYIITRAPP